MKNTYFNIFCLMLSVVFTGCTKDLDLSPRDTLSDASFWKTPLDFQKGANVLYPVLPGFGLLYSRDYLYDTDADLVFYAPNSVSNSTQTTPDTDGNWNNHYTYIRNCNNLIEKASASSIAGDVKVYLAEAKFFRAFCYWQLYRAYGGVPVVDKVLDIDSPELYGSRNTEKETVDFILQDLKEAIPDLPEEDQVSAANKGRITKGAAHGLRARVALFEGTWRKFRNGADANEYLDIAIESANAVINSQQYALFASEGAESYRKMFDYEGNNSSESILARRYEYMVSMHNFPQQMCYGGYQPTKQLADMYLCMDGLPVERSPLFEGYEKFSSEFNNRDPRMSQTFMIPGTVANAHLFPASEHWPFYPWGFLQTGYIMFKYVQQNPLYNTPPNHERQHYHRHIIRYAEVLLILAEASYEKNGNISDDDLNRTINMLRQRAGLTTSLTNAFVAANSLNMRDEIRRERTVELALEGFRWDDLRRWKTAETELVKAIRGTKIVGTEWATQPVVIDGTDRNSYPLPEWQSRTDADGFIVSEAASARSSFNPDKHYLSPLPAREIQLNPQLQQNPGW